MLCGVEVIFKCPQLDWVYSVLDDFLPAQKLWSDSHNVKAENAQPNPVDSI